MIPPLSLDARSVDLVNQEALAGLGSASVAKPSMGFGRLLPAAP